MGKFSCSKSPLCVCYQYEYEIFHLSLFSLMWKVEVFSILKTMTTILRRTSWCFLEEGITFCFYLLSQISHSFIHFLLLLCWWWCCCFMKFISIYFMLSLANTYIVFLNVHNFTEVETVFVVWLLYFIVSWLHFH